MTSLDGLPLLALYFVLVFFYKCIVAIVPEFALICCFSVYAGYFVLPLLSVAVMLAFSFLSVSTCCFFFLFLLWLLSL